MADSSTGGNTYISKRLQWLGLVENPYLPYPDNRYFFPLAEQKFAYQDITSMITEKSYLRNLCIVVGEPGSGKTTLAQRLVSAAFHGSYLSAIGLLLGKEDATPARLVKRILTSLGAKPATAKTQKERMTALRGELEQRMTVLNESIFLAFDTVLVEETLETLQELMDWTYGDQSLVQAAVFANQDAFLNMKDIASRGLVRTLSTPPVRELAELIRTLATMAGRASPLFTDTALASLIDRSHRNLGELMLLADRSLQALIQSDADIVDDTMVATL